MFVWRFTYERGVAGKRVFEADHVTTADELLGFSGVGLSSALQQRVAAELVYSSVTSP